MDLSHSPRAITKADHAGHVGGIPLVEDAVVEKEKIAVAADGLVRKVVDFPAIGPIGHDGWKGVSFDFLSLGHFSKDESLYSSFGQIRFHLRKNSIEDLFVDFLRLLYDRNFSGRFGLAYRFDDGERLDFVGGQFFLPMDEIGC